MAFARPDPKTDFGRQICKSLTQGWRLSDPNAIICARPTCGNLDMITFLPGGYEIWIILLIAMLFFGNRIPGVARSLGSGITEFKKGLKGEPDSGDKKKLEGGASVSPGASTDDGPKAEG